MDRFARKAVLTEDASSVIGVFTRVIIAAIRSGKRKLDELIHSYFRRF